MHRERCCLAASGSYKQSRGNLDPTAHYFFWVSNYDSDRLDALMVEVPYQKFSGPDK
ncbi:MAG: hypothetical protein ACRES9_08140 [Gammaproteobacteria bacterium]